MPMRAVSRSRRVSDVVEHGVDRHFVVAANGEIVLPFALAGPFEHQRGDAARQERHLVGVGLLLGRSRDRPPSPPPAACRRPAGLRRMPASVLPSYGISTRSPGGSRYGSAAWRHAICFLCAAFICAMIVREQERGEVIVDAGALQAFAGGEEMLLRQRLAAELLVMRGALPTRRGTSRRRMRSTPVTSSKSVSTTPLATKRAPQCAIADLSTGSDDMHDVLGVVVKGQSSSRRAGTTA